MNERYVQRLSMHAYVKVDSGIYFSALNHNGLYSYDVEKDELSYICSFQDEVLDRRHLHSDVVRVGEKLYFIPMNGSSMHIYDLKTGAVTAIGLQQYVAQGVPSKFNKAFVVGDKILLIPGRSHYIIIFDTCTEEIYADNEWFRKSHLEDSSMDIICKYAAFIRGDELYMFSCRNSDMLRVSLEDYSAKVTRIDGNEKGYLDAVYDAAKQEVWLLENGNNGIVRLELDTNLTERYEFADRNEISGLDYPYMSLSDISGDIYIISYQAGRTVRFNKDKKTSVYVSWDKSLPEAAQREWNAYHYHAWKLDRNRLLVSNTGDLSFQIICGDEQEKEFYFEDKNIMRRIAIRKNQFFKENAAFGLEDFLNAMGSRT